MSAGDCEARQLYALALRFMSSRQFTRHLAMAARLRACGAAGCAGFTPHLDRVRSPLQLEHALEQWEAEVADRPPAPVLCHQWIQP